MSVDGNMIVWKGFGRIILGEIHVKGHERRLTMVRLAMGSNAGGTAAAGDGQSNGDPITGLKRLAIAWPSFASQFPAGDRSARTNTRSPPTSAAICRRAQGSQGRRCAMEGPEQSPWHWDSRLLEAEALTALARLTEADAILKHEPPPAPEF